MRGLIITRSDVGILLISGADNTITCNLIGTDAAGAAGLGNGGNGIEIDGSSGNQIGGTNPGDRNVIAGNGSSQILVTGLLAFGNQIQGNTIGVDPSGTVDITSGGGIDLIDAPNNVIGGASWRVGNHIAGSNFSGIPLCRVRYDGNDCAGQLDRTGQHGSRSLGNTYGISFINVSGALIGGSAPRRQYHLRKRYWWNSI